jgi:hypothetical protein
MSNRKPLMPKATAVWLVENTALSFEQVAEFCGLHVLEVKGIADGDVAGGIKGLDPVVTGQLTREEISKAEKNPNHQLQIAQLKVPVTPSSTRKGPRYTPVSRRQDRPNAVLWLIRNHAELKDSQIMRLVGTTKPTIQQIRDRSHWNSANLTPQDPVGLGLCSQVDLDAEVAKAAKRSDKSGADMDRGGTLLPTAMTAGGLGSLRPQFDVSAPGAEQPDIGLAKPLLSEREEEALMRASLEQLSEAGEDDGADDVGGHSEDGSFAYDEPAFAEDGQPAFDDEGRPIKREGAASEPAAPEGDDQP